MSPYLAADAYDFPTIDEFRLIAFAERIAALNNRYAAALNVPREDAEALRLEREAVWREVPPAMHRYLSARLVSMRSQGVFR